MPTPVIMPKVDMDQEKATIISWEKKEGEAVKQDETILIVETEKVAIDVTSPADGILAGIKFQAGDVVPVATVIAQILKPGEKLADQTVAPPPSSSAPSGDAPTPPTPSAPVQASPLAVRLAQELGVDINRVPSQKGKITREDVEAYAASMKEAAKVETAVAGKIAATPAARRISEESGIPLAGVKGSGPFGRIQAADVKPSVMSAASIASSTDRPAEIIPLIGIRAKIAQRMQSSFQQAPHIAETVEADISRLEDARVHLNELAALKGEGKVSLTAIVVKLVAWTLERHPYINSSLIDEKIHLWKDINIGVAAALEDGLIVPVVHGANKLSFGETAEKLNDLSRRAREGKLDGWRGSTRDVHHLQPGHVRHPPVPRGDQPAGERYFGGRSCRAKAHRHR